MCLSCKIHRSQKLGSSFINHHLYKLDFSYLKKNNGKEMHSTSLFLVTFDLFGAAKYKKYKAKRRYLLQEVHYTYRLLLAEIYHCHDRATQSTVVF